MNLEFAKMHGSGNDFILVNNYYKQYDEWSPEFVKSICARHTGIGADGFLVLEKDEQSDFFMRFYNSDGFESDMCANGSRCICKFAYDLKIVKNNFHFRARDGLHQAFILGSNTVKVQVNLIDIKKSQEFPGDIILPEEVHYKGFLNTGVPHLILECTNVDELDVYKIGRDLRYHSFFKPEGTNVNFVEVVTRKKKLKVRTYERGVEEETLSCGSGVTAAAILFAQAEQQNSAQYEIITAGGNLTVYISEDNQSIYLEGPVGQVYKGMFS